MYSLDRLAAAMVNLEIYDILVRNRTEMRAPRARKEPKQNVFNINMEINNSNTTNITNRVKQTVNNTDIEVNNYDRGGDKKKGRFIDCKG